MMMLPLIGASLIGMTAAQGAASGDLAHLFVSACFDGTVRLRSGEASPVGFDNLPGAVRSKLGAPAKAQVWQLRSGGDSYLYVLEYEGRKESPRICGVASNALPIAPAADVVAARLGTTVGDVSSRGDAIEWWLPDGGHRAVASRLREYTVLQVNQFTDDQRKEADRAQ